VEGKEKTQEMQWFLQCKAGWGETVSSLNQSRRWGKPVVNRNGTPAENGGQRKNTHLAQRETTHF
jgi:hypothetical protein